MGMVGIILPYRPLFWLMARLSKLDTIHTDLLSACRVFFGPEAGEAATLAVPNHLAAGVVYMDVVELLGYFAPSMVTSALKASESEYVAAALMRHHAQALSSPSTTAICRFVSFLFRVASDRVGIVDPERLPATLEGFRGLSPKDLVVTPDDITTRWSAGDDKVAELAHLDKVRSLKLSDSPTVPLEGEALTAATAACTVAPPRFVDTLSVVGASIAFVSSYSTSLSGNIKKSINVNPSNVLAQLAAIYVWTLRDVAYDRGASSTRLCEFIVTLEASEVPPEADIGSGNVISSIADELSGRLSEQGLAPGTMCKLRRYAAIPPHAWLTAATVQRVASTVVRLAAPMIYNASPKAQDCALHALALMLHHAAPADALAVYPLIAHGIGAVQPHLRVAGMRALRRCMRGLGSPYVHPVSPQGIRSVSLLLRAVYDPAAPEALFDDGTRWAAAAGRMKARLEGRPVTTATPLDVPTAPNVPVGAEQRWGWTWQPSPYAVVRDALNKHAAFVALLPLALDSAYAALDVNASMQTSAAMALASSIFATVPLDWDPSTAGRGSSMSPQAVQSDPSAAASPPKGGGWVLYGLRQMPPVARDAVVTDVTAALDAPYVKAAIEALPDDHVDKSDGARAQVLALARDVDQAIGGLRARLPSMLDRFADRLLAYAKAQNVRQRPFSAPGAPRNKRNGDDLATASYCVLASTFLMNLSPQRRRVVVTSWVSGMAGAMLAGTLGLQFCGALLVAACRALAPDDAAALVVGPLMDSVLDGTSDDPPDLLPDEAVQRFYLLALVLRVGGMAVRHSERVLHLFRVWYRPALVRAMENRVGDDEAGRHAAVCRASFGASGNLTHVDVAHVFMKLMRSVIGGLLTVDCSMPPLFAVSNVLPPAAELATVPDGIIVGSAASPTRSSTAASPSPACGEDDLVERPDETASRVAALRTPKAQTDDDADDDDDGDDDDDDTGILSTEDVESDLDDSSHNTTYVAATTLPAVCVVPTGASIAVVEWRMPTAASVSLAIAVYDLVSDLVASFVVKASRHAAAALGVPRLPGEPLALEEDMLSGRAMARCMLARTATDISALRACDVGGGGDADGDSVDDTDDAARAAGHATATDGVRIATRVLYMLLNAARPMLPGVPESGVFDTAGLSPLAAAATRVGHGRPRGFVAQPFKSTVADAHRGVLRAARASGKLRWSPAALHGLLAGVVTLSEVYYRTASENNTAVATPLGGRSHAATAMGDGAGGPMLDAPLSPVGPFEAQVQAPPAAAQTQGHPPPQPQPGQSQPQPGQSQPQAAAAAAHLPAATAGGMLLSPMVGRGLLSPMLPAGVDGSDSVTPWFADARVLRRVVSALGESLAWTYIAGLNGSRLRHAITAVSNTAQSAISKTLSIVADMRKRERPPQYLDGLYFDTIAAVTLLVATTRSVAVSLAVSQLQAAMNTSLTTTGARDRAILLGLSGIRCVAQRLAKMDLPIVETALPKPTRDPLSTTDGPLATGDDLAATENIIGAYGSVAVPMGATRSDGSSYEWASRAVYPSVWADSADTSVPTPISRDDAAARRRFIDVPAGPALVPQLPGWYSLVPFSYDYERDAAPVTNVAGGDGADTVRSPLVDMDAVMSPSANVAVNVVNVLTTSTHVVMPIRDIRLARMVAIAATALSVPSVADEIARNTPRVGWTHSRALELLRQIVTNTTRSVTECQAGHSLGYQSRHIPLPLIGLPTAFPHANATSARVVIRALLGDRVLRSIEHHVGIRSASAAAAPDGEPFAVGDDIIPEDALIRHVLEVHHTISSRIIICFGTHLEAPRQPTLPSTDSPFGNSMPPVALSSVLLWIASVFMASTTPSVAQAARVFALHSLRSIKSGHVSTVVATRAPADLSWTPRPLQSQWTLGMSTLACNKKIESAWSFSVKDQQYVKVADASTTAAPGAGYVDACRLAPLPTPRVTLPGPVLGGVLAPGVSDDHMYMLGTTPSPEVVTDRDGALRAVPWLRDADVLRRFLWTIAALSGRTVTAVEFIGPFLVVGPGVMDMLGDTVTRIIDAGVAASERGNAAPGGDTTDPAAAANRQRTTPVAGMTPQHPACGYVLSVTPPGMDPSDAQPAQPPTSPPTSPAEDAFGDGMSGRINLTMLEESMCCSLASALACTVLIAATVWPLEEAFRAQLWAADVIAQILKKGSIASSEAVYDKFSEAFGCTPLPMRAPVVAFVVELVRKALAHDGALDDPIDAPVVLCGTPATGDGVVATAIRTAREAARALATTVTRSVEHRARYLSLLHSVAGSYSRFSISMFMTVLCPQLPAPVLPMPADATAAAPAASIEGDASQAPRRDVGSPLMPSLVTAAAVVSPLGPATTPYYATDATTAAAFALAGAPLPALAEGETVDGHDFSCLFAAQYDALRGVMKAVFTSACRWFAYPTPVVPTLLPDDIQLHAPFLAAAQLRALDKAAGCVVDDDTAPPADRLVLDSVDAFAPLEALPLIRWLVVAVLGSLVTAIETAAAVANNIPATESVLVPVPPLTEGFGPFSQELLGGLVPTAATKGGYVRVRVGDAAAIATHLSSVIDESVAEVQVLGLRFLDTLVTYQLRLAAASYRDAHDAVVTNYRMTIKVTSLSFLLPVRRLLLFSLRLLSAAVDPELPASRGLSPSVLRSLALERAIGAAYEPDPLDTPAAYITAAERAVAVGDATASWRARQYLLCFSLACSAYSFRNWPISSSSSQPLTAAGRDTAPLTGLMLGAGSGSAAAYVSSLPQSVASLLTPEPYLRNRAKTPALRAARYARDDAEVSLLLPRFVSGAVVAAASRLLFDPRAEVRSTARDFVRGGVAEMAGLVRDALFISPMLDSLPGGLDGNAERHPGASRTTLYAVRVLSCIVLASKSSIPSYIPPLLQRLSSLSHNGSNEVVTAIRETFSQWWKEHQELWELGGSERFSEAERDAVKELVYAPSFYA